MQQFIQTVTEWLVQLPGAILHLLNNTPVEVFYFIGGTVVFSVVVAFAKTFIQRKWDKVPSDTKMALINLGGILVSAFGTYLSMTPEQDPATAIFTLVGAGFLVQQPIFFRFVKPMVNNFWENWDKARGLNSDLDSAAIPEGGLPIETK